MKTSARNQFLGKVKSVKQGPINAEVVLDIGGGDELAAVITQDSAEHLGLTEGMEVMPLVKAPCADRRRSTVIAARETSAPQPSAR